MATYTPKALAEQVALTTSDATYYTATAVTGVIRTIQVSTPSGGKTFTMSLKTDAAGTRIFEAYALTASVPSIFNGWWIVTASATVRALCSATAVSLGLYGYEFA